MIDHFGLVGQRLDGKYDIEEAVAKGGCGVVYRARHHVLNEPVAVKVLRIPEKLSAADRAAFVLNFMSEAKTIARLKHPAIVRVIDFNVSTLGDGRQTPWMVLEWIEGERPRRPSPFSVPCSTRSRTRTARASRTATSSPATSCSRCCPTGPTGARSQRWRARTR
jgi:serine/threonine protein kinase